jgi:DNA-binding NtrC family response regulator
LKKYGGANPPVLTEEAMQALMDYRWPGNVRELRNVIERAVLLANGGVIHAHDLPLMNVGGGNGTGTAVTTSNGTAVSLAELERRHIESVLRQSNWHQGRAAMVLGISSKTLYRKIRDYGFSRPKGA